MISTKSTKNLYLALTIVLILGLIVIIIRNNSSADVVTPNSSPTPLTDGKVIDAVPGEILVKFKTTATDSDAADILKQNNLTDKGNKELAKIHVKHVTLPGQASAQATEAVVKALSNNPKVEFAETNKRYSPSLVPNDPSYSNQWYLKNINAEPAWDVTTGSSSIIAAVIDTGVMSAHEDLRNNIVPGINAADGTTVTDDVYGHGTKVAGTIAAVGNNRAGVASVAWNVKIMPIRVTVSTDTGGSASISAIASGLTWAADHGARVANISYMITDSFTGNSAAQYMQDKGGVVTASAGNYATVMTSPDNPSILTVSATDANNNRYSWSNSGTSIDVAAPGDVYTTTNSGSYINASGTSFSSPITAGVAAIVLSVNPGLTGAQASDVIKKSALDVGPTGWDADTGWGIVNLCRAVALAQTGSLPADPKSCGTAAAPTTQSPSPSPLPSPTPTPITADTTVPTVSINSPIDGATVATNQTVSATAADNQAVTKVELYVDGKLTTSSTTAPFTTKWNTKKATTGSHTLQEKAYDAAGNVGTSAIVTVKK